MNILLVYPEMPDTFYGMRHALKLAGKKSSFPPLGLLTIAPMLPESWNKKLIDVNAEPLTDKALEWADLVLLSAMNVQEVSVREIIKQCNQAGVKIIAGGSLFTHEHYRFPEVDYFVLNEAEITLPLFLKDLEAGEPKRIYESIEFADVSLTPIPDYSLIKKDAYIYNIVQYSRGCPYMCDFCDVTALFGRKPRTKSNEQIIAELEAMLEIDPYTSMVLFADDNLIGNKRILKSDLLPALIEWRKKRKPGFYFSTQLTINLADDDELMRMMLEAGFRYVFIGIETPDESGLKTSKKTQNLKRNQLENIHKLHRNGFIVAGGFIVGFDSDSTDIFRQQVEFIQESGIPLPIVNILKAPPGTELFDKIKSQGRLNKEFAFTEGETNMITVMDEKSLYEGYLSLTQSIYTPEEIFKRYKKFFEVYRNPKTEVKIKLELPPEFILSGIKSIFKMAFLLPEKRYFWKMLRWTWKNHRNQLDKAVYLYSLLHQMHQTHLFIRQTVLTQNAHIWKQEEPAEITY